MIKLLKNIYRTSTIGQKVLFPIKRCYDFIWVRVLPEKLFLSHIYKLRFKRKLCFDNPRTIQEKYLWLRLNDKTQLHTQCADKYLVRNYIKEKIGNKYLIPLLFQTKNSKDITKEKLPNIPIIIKTNHACGGHTIIKDKKKVCYRQLQKKLKRDLKKKFYYRSRQWQYKNIIPRIIIEKLLIDKSNQKLFDYKLHCYNGTVVLIEVYFYIQNKKSINFYDTSWNKLDMRVRTRNNLGKVDKPKNLSEMISIAEKLSTDFRFVRVDTYNLNGDIYVGELTFTPAVGIQGFLPEKWNYIFGDMLKL